MTGSVATAAAALLDGSIVHAAAPAKLLIKVLKEGPLKGTLGVMELGATKAYRDYVRCIYIYIYRGYIGE